MSQFEVSVSGEKRASSPRYDDDMDDVDSGFYTTTTDGGSVFEEDRGSFRGGSVKGGAGGSVGGAGGSVGGASGGSTGIDPLDAHLGARSDAERSACVCRINVPDADPGLGFLVRHEGRDKLLTTHALVDSIETAQVARVTFRYGASKSKRIKVALKPQLTFITDMEIGYTLVACDGDDLARVGAESLNLPAWDLDTVKVDTPLTSFGGDAARRALRKGSHVVKRVSGPFFWFVDDERSSGSLSEGAPLFRDNADLVGMHLGFDEDADMDWGMQLCAATAHIFVPRVVKLMRERRSQAVIQSRGCLALAFVTYRSEPAREDVVAKGGVPVIIAGLRRHMTEVLVVQQACGALGNIAAGASHACQDSIVRADGIRAMVDALGVHMADPRVSEGCLRAFANVAVGPDTRKQKMMEERTLPAIVAAMDMHSLISSIQEAGCRSLASMSFGSNKRKDAVISEGGHRAVVRAMSEHPEDGHVQLNGAIALLDLSAGGGERTAHVYEADGVRVLVDAMRQFPGSAKLQEYAMMALWNIAGGDKKRRLAVRDAAADLPADVKDRFDDDTGVQTASKDLIKRLDGKDRCAIM